MSGYTGKRADEALRELAGDPAVPVAERIWAAGSALEDARNQSNEARRSLTRQLGEMATDDVLPVADRIGACACLVEWGQGLPEVVTAVRVLRFMAHDMSVPADWRLECRELISWHNGHR